MLSEVGGLAEAGKECRQDADAAKTHLKTRRWSYFAEEISSTMDWAAARGSGAAVMGRPTTIKSAPALMASVGVAVRAWSSVRAAGLSLDAPVALASDFVAGRTPGVTIRKSRPQALRMARAS